MSAWRASIVLLLGVAVTACSTSPGASSTDTTAVAIPTATAALATMTPQPDPPTPSPTLEPTEVPVPPAPAEVDHFAWDKCLVEDCTRVQWTHTVLWRTPPSTDTMILVYGVTECLEKPANPKYHPDVTGPCLLPDTVVPASALQPLRSAPASDGWMRWVWVEDDPDTCDGWPWEELFSSPGGEDFYAIVVAASNASGHSPYVIADPGKWQGAYMGCGE